MKLITISTDLLSAVAQWSYKSSTNDDRPRLAVVAIMGGELVATDGHRMARIPVDVPSNVRLSIGRYHIDAAVAAQRALNGRTFCDSNSHGVTRIYRGDDGDGSRLVLGLSEAVALRIPAGRIEDFRPIDQVLPKRTPTTPPNGVVVDPRYIALIADVQDVVDRAHGKRGIKLTSWGDPDENGDRHEPLLIEGGGGTRYIIMPMRDTISSAGSAT